MTPRLYSVAASVALVRAAAVSLLRLAHLLSIKNSLISLLLCRLVKLIYLSVKTL